MNTWPALLAHQAQIRPLAKAIRYKHYGIWQSLTWKDYYTEVKHLALGLASLGLSSGDTLLIIGDNAPAWHASELAAQAMHAVPVGVHPDLGPSAIRDVALVTNATLAVVEDQEQVDKLLEVREGLPGLKKIVYWNYKGLAHYKDAILTGYREVLAAGASASDGDRFERELGSVRPGDTCALVPTSGSGRCAVHTFESIGAGASAFGTWSSEDEIVPLTPAAWITGQWIMQNHLASGCILNFAEDPETRARDAQEIEPTIVVQGARFWESQAASLQARIEANDAMKRFLFRALLKAGKAPGLLARILLTRPIRKTLGLSRARACYSIGGVLSPDARAFWRTLGVPITDLYATTEAGAIARDGELLPGVEARISDDEIVVKSAGVSAGYRDGHVPTDNGWVGTGDSGSIQDGRLTFVDRKRDIVQVSGQTLAPQQIECRLRFSPSIKDAWVFGSRDSVAAVVVVNFASVGAWAGRKRISFSTMAELASAPEVYDLIARDIGRVNGALPGPLKIGCFVNLPTELADEEITFGGGFVREKLFSHYAGIVDGIGQKKATVEFGRTTLSIRGVTP